MLRRVVVGALVAASMGLAAPAGAQGVPDAGSAERSTSIKTAVREYGDGPVRVHRGQLLRLRFQGRKGDRVGVAGGKRVDGVRYYERLPGRVRLGGTRPDGGFFTLPRSGWFTIRYHASRAFQRVYNVQLLRQQRVEADPARRLRLPARLGTMYVVGVRAPASGLSVASFGDAYIADLDSSLKASRLAGGSKIVLGDSWSLLGVRPGARVWVPLAPSRAADVRVGPITRVSTSVDGDPVRLRSGALGYDVSFEAAAGQELRTWVAAEPMTPAGEWGMSLWSPDGAAYQHSQFGLLEVASAGTQHAIFLPRAGAAGETQFSVDSLIEGPPIQVGTVSTYAPSPDGRWTAATIIGDDYPLLWVTNAPSADSRVVVGDPFAGLAPDCTHGSNSCGEQYYWAGGNGVTAMCCTDSSRQDRLVLATPPGVTGTVHVRLTGYDW